MPFIISLVEESKYCNELMNKNFNKKLVKTKEDNEDFKNSTKSWICDNDYTNNDIKVRDHCHITGKYTGSAHRDCNINPCFMLLPCFMQELGKFNLKISFIPNNMSFTINNMLSFY